MNTCQRCKETPHYEDYHALGRRRHLGSPGLHVRRWLCKCGCKSVEFYTVMNVSLIRSRFPRPGYQTLIPQQNFPIFEGVQYGNA